MTKKPHKTLRTATHREQPAVKVEYESGRTLSGNESSKAWKIFTHVSQNDFNKFKNPIDDLILEDDS